jgi:DNA repair ATPase RecN
VRELVMNGLKVRLTKYKLIIYEEVDKEVSDHEAQVIAQYLYQEGFIKKDEFPVEILRIED